MPLFFKVSTFSNILRNTPVEFSQTKDYRHCQKVKLLIGIRYNCCWCAKAEVVTYQRNERLFWLFYIITELFRIIRKRSAHPTQKIKKVLPDAFFR